MDLNWSQLRDRIDRESGDKIAVEDPAAAPLGTDAEAGGAATSSEHVTSSTAAEQAGPAARAAAQRKSVAQPRRALLGLALAAVAVMCVVAALALALIA
jgi:hypothetical protein